MHTPHSRTTEALRHRDIQAAVLAAALGVGVWVATGTAIFTSTSPRIIMV